jgi:hypothetical protein
MLDIKKNPERPLPFGILHCLLDLETTSAFSAAAIAIIISIVSSIIPGACN